LQAYKEDTAMNGASDVEWEVWSNCEICVSVNFLQTLWTSRRLVLELLIACQLVFFFAGVWCWRLDQTASNFLSDVFLLNYFWYCLWQTCVQTANLLVSYIFC
jgi:hypothetical protein